jgi:hypothetical protein
MAHPARQLLFVLFSLADLGLTGWLLDHSGGRVYEANPLAGWFLARHGWAGLVCFKGAVVLLVLALLAVVARSRPRLAARVLTCSCALLAGVLLYSVSLCQAALLPPHEREARLAGEDPHRLAGVGGGTDEEPRSINEFRARLAARARGLAEGRCSLLQVGRWVAHSERGKRLLQFVGRHDPATPEESLPELGAALAINHAVVLFKDDPPLARAVALRLGQEFRRTFGHPPPALLCEGSAGGARTRPVSGVTAPLW